MNSCKCSGSIQEDTPLRVANKVGYAWGVRIECRLRTIVYSHIIRHSRIQCQRGISNWPLWLKTHCSTRAKNCHAEAAIRVKSSPKHLLQPQVPGHNRTGNPRFTYHIHIHIINPAEGKPRERFDWLFPGESQSPVIYNIKCSSDQFG